MENEVIHTVLTEVLVELREMKQQQGREARAVMDLKGKLEQIEPKFSDGEPVRVARQTANIAAAVLNEMDTIKSIISAEPKSIRKEFRILLFPECNAAEYYRIVFGRLLFWIVIFLVATYLFSLGREYIQANAKAREWLIEEVSYRKAWNYLYQNGSKSMKRRMDTAWVKNMK